MGTPHRVCSPPPSYRTPHSFTSSAVSFPQPAPETRTRISGCCPTPVAPGICMEGRRAQPSHDGHMPHGERDTGSATISIPPPHPPPPPLSRRGPSGGGEGVLLFSASRDSPVPRHSRVPAPLYPCPSTSLRSRVPLPDQALPCSCTSVSLSPGCSSGTGCSGFRWCLIKDSTFSSLTPR